MIDAFIYVAVFGFLGLSVFAGYVAFDIFRLEDKATGLFMTFLSVFSLIAAAAIFYVSFLQPHVGVMPLCPVTPS